MSVLHVTPRHGGVPLGIRSNGDMRVRPDSVTRVLLFSPTSPGEEFLHPVLLADEANQQLL